MILPLVLPDPAPVRTDPGGERHACEILIHTEGQLIDCSEQGAEETSAERDHNAPVDPAAM